MFERVEDRVYTAMRFSPIGYLYVRLVNRGALRTVNARALVCEALP